MQEKNLIELAEKNLQAFASNSYPGRCIFIGQNDKNTHIIHGYAIMGRSDKSRNRFFVADHATGKVSTEIFDKSKLGENEDISLIVYDAMLETDDYYAVSNGEQTRSALLCAFAECGLMASKFMAKYEYENDKPNFTPRITAVTTLDKNSFDLMHEMLLFKKSPFSDSQTIHYHAYADICPGFGYVFHTYDENGEPLPSFTKDPYVLPLMGDQQTVLNTLWNALNSENRVSLAVKFIEILTGNSTIMIINKNKKENE